jgi:phage terminase Nu1 subunit (DNA packaging protein)
MGDLVEFPRQPEAIVTYRQLGQILGCSQRKLRYLKKEGMPDLGISGYDRSRKFSLSAVQQWLGHREAERNL